MAGFELSTEGGPLAEREWSDFNVQPYDPGITLYGGDRDALDYLREGFGDVDCLQPEAWEFLGKPEVQRQIDRVVRGLLEHKRLARNQVIAVSGFTERLCSRDWLVGAFRVQPHKHTPTIAAVAIRKRFCSRWSARKICEARRLFTRWAATGHGPAIQPRCRDASRKLRCGGCPPSDRR
jgi:hypothetical protein